MNIASKTLALAATCLLALSIAGAQAAEKKTVEKSKETATSKPSYGTGSLDFYAAPVNSPPPPSIYTGPYKSLPTPPAASSPSRSTGGSSASKAD